MDRTQTPAPFPGSTLYGLPPEAFVRAWSIQDIRDYAGIGRTNAYALMRRQDAPPPLNVGGAHRWNGLQVIAWMHGDNWREVSHSDVAGHPPDLPQPAPSAPLDAPSATDTRTAAPVLDTRPADESTHRARLVPGRASLVEPVRDGHPVREPSVPTREHDRLAAAGLSSTVDPGEVHAALARSRLTALIKDADGSGTGDGTGRRDPAC